MSDYGGSYSKMGDKVYKKYGTEHLCGNCKYTTTCARAKIQCVNNKGIKSYLMETYAPFVKHFEVETLTRNKKDEGFVAVYDCEKFEFHGV